MNTRQYDLACEPPLKRFKLLQEEIQGEEGQSVVPRSLDNELSTYLVERTMYLQNGGQERGGLQFWIERQSSFPLLAPLALDLLSAPASQAYVERVFSVCSDLTQGKRTRLTHNLEKRTFLKVNAKYYDL